MNETLNRYLQILWRTGDHEAAVIDAAEWCRSTSPWRVVEEAGLLARCHVEKATSDISLTADLRVRGAQSKTGVQRIEAGALYPVLQNHGRLKKGAFDTPRKMAREVVRHALHAASGPVRTALDGACGTGTFLVALQEAGVEQIMGSDLDSLALKVAKIAVPKADIRLADALDQGPLVDCVVGNPPFVRPERQTKEVRQAAKARFPWLKGRFDLVVPFAFSASERCRFCERASITSCARCAPA